MRLGTRAVCAALVLLLPFWGPSCGDDDGQAAPVAGALSIVSGDAQTGEAGATLSRPLTVRVEDDQGQPLEGASVAWSVTGGGGSVSPAQSQTGSDGTASTTWTLGTTAGAQQARAAVDGAGTVTFGATATAGAPASVSISPDELRFDGLGQTGTLDVTVEDEHGNAVESPEVSYASSDESVATVDAAGEVTSRGEGDAEITATAGSASASVPVVVELARFEPSGDTTVSGTLEVPELVVGSGVTVTAGGPLTLVVAGAVSIEGSLEGECQPITVNGGDVTITGRVDNGCGGSRDQAGDLSILASGTLEIADAELVSDGDVTISNEPEEAASVLRAAGIEPLVAIPGRQSGGESADCVFRGTTFRPVVFTDTSPLPGGAIPGGDFTLGCAGHLAVLTPTLRLQWGQPGLGQPFDGPGDYPSGTAGDGARGGDIVLRGGTIELDGGDLFPGGGGDGGDWYANGLDPEAVGGAGGRSGVVRVISDATATVEDFFGPLNPQPAGDGGDGTAVGDPGSDATARGGEGGSVGAPDIVWVTGDDVEVIIDLVIFEDENADAGDGGLAHAIPGDGVPGTYLDLDGLPPGDGFAFGGAGGDVHPVFERDGEDVFVGDPGAGGGLLFEGATGHAGGGSCRIDRPADRAGAGGAGGSADGAPGEPGSAGGIFGDPGTITLSGFGNGGAGGRANDPGQGGPPGSHPFDDPAIENSLTPGPPGQICRWSGPITSTVSFDPSGHEPFTRYTTVSSIEIEVTPPGEEGGQPVIEIDGSGPWVPVSGLLDLEVAALPDFVEISDATETVGFLADGRGTVAGFSNVSVEVLTATLRLGENGLPLGFVGEIELGGQGELPGGQPERLDLDADVSLEEQGVPPRALRIPGSGEDGEPGVLGATRVPLRPEPDRPDGRAAFDGARRWNPPWARAGSAGEGREER